MASRIVVMAGGTGGHVFPALAVAEELRKRGWQVSWLGTADSFESHHVPEYGIELDTIGAFRLRGQGLAGLPLAPYRLLKAINQARKVLAERKPQVVLGMGGFAAGPGGLASKLMGLPLVIHEQNRIPGLTNRWLAKMARRVLQAFPASFPSKVAAITTGNPVREEIVAIPEPAERYADHRDGTRILVLGGSLGAQALNEIVPEALALLAENQPLAIRHQAGRNKAEAAIDLYARLCLTAEVSEFLTDMAQAYAWADVVICRAGALTVSELAAVGVASILVPFPFAVDDHQTRNGEYLVEGDAGIVMQQDRLEASHLAGELNKLISKPGKLLEMAQAARRLARPDATKKVADYCEQVKQA